MTTPEDEARLSRYALCADCKWMDVCYRTGEDLYRCGGCLAMSNADLLARLAKEQVTGLERTQREVAGASLGAIESLAARLERAERILRIAADGMAPRLPRPHGRGEQVSDHEGQPCACHCAELALLREVEKAAREWDAATEGNGNRPDIMHSLTIRALAKLDAHRKAQGEK